MDSSARPDNVDQQDNHQDDDDDRDDEDDHDDDHDDDLDDDHDDLPPLVAQQGEPIETSSIGHTCRHLAQTFHISMNQDQDKDDNFQHGHGSPTLSC